VIFLSDIKNEHQLDAYEPLTRLVREKVYPERMRLRDTSSGKQLKKKWWAYQAHRPKLYEKARQFERVLVTSLVSSHLSFVFVPSASVFSHKLGVIPTDKFSTFANVQARPHEVWTRFLSAPVGTGVSYSPSDCFSTFPFPLGFEADVDLERAGHTYHDYRAALMASRDEGMTSIYNHFHDRSQNAPDITRLRNLHAEMDAAVLRAYDWHDLADRARPEFVEQEADEGKEAKTRLDWPSEFKDEVLARLLALNAERHSEEVRLGIAPGMKGQLEAEDDEEASEEELTE
jgi:hypothetical protein